MYVTAHQRKQKKQQLQTMAIQIPEHSVQCDT